MVSTVRKWWREHKQRVVSAARIWSMTVNAVIYVYECIVGDGMWTLVFDFGSAAGLGRFSC